MALDPQTSPLQRSLVLGMASFPALFSNWEICLTKSGGFCKTLWDPELTEEKKIIICLQAYPIPSSKRQTEVGSRAEKKKKKKKNCTFMDINTSEIMISAISVGENPFN